MEDRRRKLWIVEGDVSRALYGSSIPGQNIYAACKLCLQERRLLLSHIAPKWAYKWIKSEGYALRLMGSIGLAAREDDGEKRYLLCEVCEQVLGSPEKYLADFCKGGVRRLAKIGITVTESGALQGVRRESITAALLGILFKAQFCDTPPWSNLKFLDGGWTKMLRDYLTGSRPIVGKKTAISASRYYSVIRPDANPKAMIFPAILRNGKSYIFEIIIGGWTWLCFLPDLSTIDLDEDVPPSLHLGPEYTSHILRNGFEWQVFHGDIMANRFVNPTGWESVPEVSGAVGDAEDCPCGIGEASFSQCCKLVWYKDQ